MAYYVSDHRVIAVFEIVSPGNKPGRRPLAALVDKLNGFLGAGIHVAIVDLFSPTKRS